MSSGKKIISNSTLLMGADIFSKGIRVLLVVMAARILGDVAYGKFTFAMAFTTLFLIVADMGLHQLLVREIARKPDMLKRLLGNALVIKSALAIFYVLFVTVIIRFRDKPADVVTTVYILAGYQIVVSYIMLLKSVFVGLQEARYDAVSTILQTVLDTLLGIGILLAGGQYMSLAAMYLLASLVNAGYCVFVISRRYKAFKLRIEWDLVTFLFKESLPFGIMFFFAMMYTYVDSVMLSYMVNDEVVGWYNAAYRLVFAMMFIPMGTMRAVFPALSKFFKESMDDFRKLFEKTCQTLFYIGVSIATFMTLFSEDIIVFLFDVEYINAAYALRILVWSTALVFVTTVMTHTTRSSDRQRFTAKVVSFGAVFNFLLNLVMIPRYSYIGAALTTLATEGLVFLVHYVYLCRIGIRPPVLRLAPKVILINGVMAAFVLYFRSWPAVLLMGAAILLNLVVTLGIRYFTRQELDYLKRLLPSFFNNRRKA